MSSGRRELVHGNMLHLDGAEHFRLRNVCGGIDVQQVSRRPVGLVAGKASVGVAPTGPTLDVGKVQIGNGLAVVVFDTGASVRWPLAEERRQLRAKVVAAAGFELSEEISRVLCAVIFKGIVEMRARLFTVIVGKRSIEGGQILVESFD